MSERGLTRKSSRELFGEVGGSFGESQGIDGYFRVASNMGFVEARVRENGLRMSLVCRFSETDVLYTVREENEESITVWMMEGSVWVAEDLVDRYGELVGVDKGVIE